MITLKYLAERLNVSVSTVSKALSDSDEISKDTIQKVKALAKELNYQPNKVALSLRQNQTKTIGVIIPNILNRFYARALFGIQNEATKLGYSIITCFTNERLDKEIESISVLSDGSVDGFLLAVSEETLISGKSSHIQELIDRKKPVIMFDRNLSEISCTKVIIDDFDIAFKVASELINKGRRHLAFISTIEDLNVGVLRRKGFENAINKYSGNDVKSYILDVKKDNDYQEQIIKFLEENKNIDAILSADNVTGTIAVNLVASLDFIVPDDISIIGFTDEVVSNLSVPKLSYIDQNAETIGESALRLIVEKLKDKESKTEISTLKIPVNIVQKETT
jgi:LacI family transcriptional regulator